MEADITEHPGMQLKKQVLQEKTSRQSVATIRETTTIWDKATGESDLNDWFSQRRTADICAKLIEEGYNDTVNKKTGLVIDPTYSVLRSAGFLTLVEGHRKECSGIIIRNN